MHSFHELTADSQAEATTASVTMHIAFQADEALKNCLLFIGRNAITLIGDFDAYHGWLDLFECSGNADGGAMGRVAQSIGNQIAENLLQTGIIGPDGNGFGDINGNLALLLENDRFKEIDNS